MPELYAIGANTDGGNVIFNASKTAIVFFSTPFPVVPRVQLTLGADGTNAPAWKVNLSKTGFTIKLSVNYTGVVTWDALK